MKKSGFTMVEILVTVAIVAILSVAAISVIKPREQQAKAFDARLQNTLSELFNASLRYQYQDDKLISSEPVSTLLMSDPEAQSLYQPLVDQGFFKATQLSSSDLDYIYLNTQGDFLALCFQPRSVRLQLSDKTLFDQSAQVQDHCPASSCYYCLSTENSARAYATGTPTPPPDPCDDFDPEWPNYPFTCNYSDTFSEFSCTNYCVHDQGCDDFCPPGQRHLVKSYYGNGADFLPCLMHWREASQDYCVPDPYANCGYKSYSSDDTDFQYGCSDPRRPYAWN